MGNINASQGAVITDKFYRKTSGFIKVNGDSYRFLDGGYKWWLE